MSRVELFDWLAVFPDGSIDRWGLTINVLIDAWHAFHETHAHPEYNSCATRDLDMCREKCRIPSIYPTNDRGSL